MPSSHHNPAHINYENQNNSKTNFRNGPNRNSLSNAGQAMMRSGGGVYSNKNSVNS